MTRPRRALICAHCGARAAVVMDDQPACWDCYNRAVRTSSERVQATTLRRTSR
jgi:hypothetical protein